MSGASLPLIAVVGPTASGKTEVAETVADSLGLVLINADAFMVYRGLDVGTNKPSRKSEYRVMDVIGPEEEFGVGEYVVRAAEELQRAWDEGKGAVLVGGTGFYVRALMEEYDDLRPPPERALREEIEGIERQHGLDGLIEAAMAEAPQAAAAIDLQNPVRVRRLLERARDPRPAIRFSLPSFTRLKFILEPDGIDAAIVERTARLLDSGWIEETEGLLQRNLPDSAPGLRAIGYDSTIGVVRGTLSREEAERRIVTETRQYARRQRTWFKSEPNVTKRFQGSVGFGFSGACAQEIIDVCISLGEQNGKSP